MKNGFENQIFKQEEHQLENTENTTNNEWQITINTIKTTIPTLKNQKASGLDEITNEMHKYDEEKWIEYVFFENIVTFKKIQENRREGITVLDLQIKPIPRT